VSDDESLIPHHDDEPAGARTPPTPAVEDSPPPSPRPQRQRLMARLRPISIPDMVSDFAGRGAMRAMSGFESRYMPDGIPSGEYLGAGQSKQCLSDYCTYWCYEHYTYYVFTFVGEAPYRAHIGWRRGPGRGI
jgi:hypothetical protein